MRVAPHLVCITYAELDLDGSTPSAGGDSPRPSLSPCLHPYECRIALKVQNVVNGIRLFIAAQSSRFFYGGLFVSEYSLGFFYHGLPDRFVAAPVTGQGLDILFGAPV